MDSDPQTMERLEARSGGAFRLDNLLAGKQSCCNVWAKGHYGCSELVEPLLDVVRREAEKCGSLQGLEVLHAVGGGTGSGLGSLLLSKLAEEFPSRTVLPGGGGGGVEGAEGAEGAA